MEQQHRSFNTVIACACGETADLRTNPHAWDGWQVSPFCKCPACIEQTISERADLSDLAQAQVRTGVVGYLVGFASLFASHARGEG